MSKWTTPVPPGAGPSTWSFQLKLAAARGTDSLTSPPRRPPAADGGYSSAMQALTTTRASDVSSTHTRTNNTSRVQPTAMKYMPEYPAWKPPLHPLCRRDDALEAAAGEEFEEHHMFEGPSLGIISRYCHYGPLLDVASWSCGGVPFLHDVAGASISLGEQPSVSRLPAP
jgi:hypothetical protein